MSAPPRRGLLRSALSLAVLATGALVAAFLFALPASAQSTRIDEQTARLIEKGVAAAAAGRYEECADAYRVAFALRQGYVAAGELGLCEEALGRNLEAYDHLLYALEGEVPAAAARAPALWKRYHEAFGRVTKRVVRVLAIVVPNEAELFIDGVSFGKFASGHHYAVTPGAHTWTAKLPGRPDVSVPQTGRGGDLPDVMLVFPDEPKEAPAPAKPERAVERPRLVIVEPFLEPPCAAAGGERMSPRLCGLFKDVYERRVNPVISVALGGLVSVGFTADPGPGFYAGVGLHWNDKDDIGFVMFGEVHTLLPTKGGTYVSKSSGEIEPLDITAVSGALVPCLRYKWVLGCAVVEGGMTLGSRPAEKNDAGVHFNGMLELGPRLGIDLPVVQRFGLRAFADLRLSPLGPDAGYGVLPTRSLVWNNPVVSGLFGLGVSFK